jgi:hypothetical protein
MIKRFSANKLVLNLDETNKMKFVTKNSPHSTVRISYKKEFIEDTLNTIFLGLQIDNHINWKNDTEETIPNLNGASYAMRMMVHTSNKNTLKSIYYAYFHSITEYGKTVWCNSTKSGKIFTYKTKLSELWIVHNQRLL